MQFKIMLTPDRPTQGELVLAPETPLSGLKFIEEVGKSLRRSIDHIARERHVTFGALSFYEITVPQRMAIDSGLFESKSTIPVIVQNDLLSHYVFYGASVDNKASGRPCYPFMNSEATLISYIDELLFLADWATLGYPERLIWNNGLMDGSYLNNDEMDPDYTYKKGCDGCPCHKEPPHGHGHHHHEHPEPPILSQIPGCPDEDQFYPSHHCCPKPNTWHRPRPWPGATVRPPAPPMPPHGCHPHPRGPRCEEYHHGKPRPIGSFTAIL